MKGFTHIPSILLGVAALALVTPAVAQDATMPRATAYGDLTKLPDWSGVWETDWGALFGGAPAKPKLTPSGQAKMDAFQKKQAAEGVAQEAQILCLPPGIPGVMRQPYPIEFVYSPGRVTLFTEAYGQARRIYTDGRALPDDPDLLFNGTSVGRWEGDTLIVDTVGLSPQTNITAGLPHGEKSRVREKIWLTKPNQIVIETTITDPDNLLEPWTTTQAYARKPDWQIREYVCAENNRLTSGEDGANINLGIEEEEDPFGDPIE